MAESDTVIDFDSKNQNISQSRSSSWKLIVFLIAYTVFVLQSDSLLENISAISKKLHYKKSDNSSGATSKAFDNNTLSPKSNNLNLIPVEQSTPSERSFQRRRLEESSASRSSIHPFLSDTCYSLLTDSSISTLSFPINQVYVILPVHNVDPQLLFASIRSILSDYAKNYQSSSNSRQKPIELKHIIIIDDYSDISVSSWDIWNQLSSDDIQRVKFLRFSVRQGKIKAKNSGIEYIKEKYNLDANKSYFIFMDLPVIASPQWLLGLTITLNKYEKAIVYPAIDILMSTETDETISWIKNGDNKEVKRKRFDVTRGDDVVAGFNWQFIPTWETISDTTRLKYTVSSPSSASSEVEYISPTVPLIFGISANHFYTLDKFDDSLFDSSFYSQENIDLSLRNWLCDGMVLQQTCSRVAVEYPNFASAPKASALTTEGEVVAIGHGITQQQIDSNVMNLATRYLSHTITDNIYQAVEAEIKATSSNGKVITRNSEITRARPGYSHHGVHANIVNNKYREIAYEARFVNRVNLLVKSNVDPIRTGPFQLTSTADAFESSNNVQRYFRGIAGGATGGDAAKANGGLLVCIDFQWLLEEVYPGLVSDAASVMVNYYNKHHAEGAPHTDSKSGDVIKDLLRDRYLNTLYKDYHTQYISRILPLSSDANTPAIIDLKSHESKAKLNYFLYARLGSTSHPTNIDNSLLNKYSFTEPIYVKKYNGFTYEELIENHNRAVREDNLCEDFKDPTNTNYCNDLSLNGDHTVCQQRKVKLLFACPKSCQFCDSSLKETKGNYIFCEDLYLMKCPAWKQQGMCEKKDNTYGVIADVCRKSCGKCTPDYLKLDASASGAAAAPVTAEVKKVAQPPPPPQQQRDPKAHMDTVETPFDVDPQLVHSQYLQSQAETSPIPDIFPGYNPSNNYCEVNDRADRQLLSHISVHHEFSPVVSSSSDYNQLNHIKIFCGIYTMAKNHGTNVAATRNTWAKKCDGFIAFSTERDPTIPSVSIQHEGEESYDNMWQKSRSIWKFIAKYLMNEYDFFLLGGDDMFYIIENLRFYLNSDEITTAREQQSGLFIGRIFQPPNQVVFNSGGAGYMLDRKALKVLAENIDSPKCFPHQHGFWEDVNIANCLQASPEHIVPYNTRDPKERERFHPFNPGNHLNYRIPPRQPDWYAKYNPTLKVGYECCSEDSISFHYLPANKLYQLYNYLYHCDQKQSS